MLPKSDPPSGHHPMPLGPAAWVGSRADERSHRHADLSTGRHRPSRPPAARGPSSGFAQDQLSPSEFQTVEAGLPGVDGLIAQAPEPSGSSSLLSQGSSLLGGSDSSAAGLGTVASSFESLGMSPDMVQQFVPIVSKYAEQVGGPEVGPAASGGAETLAGWPDPGPVREPQSARVGP